MSDAENMAEQDKSIQERMDGADVATANAQEAGTGAHEPVWWVDSKTPGQGDRPDWLHDKFKTAEDAAKAYHELEKKFTKAPEEYDWSKGKGWIDLEYEPFHEMASLAKAKRVPQEVMDSMLGAVGKYLDEFKVDYTEEKAKLGDNAEDRLRVLSNWAKANFSENTFAALTENMKTADAVLAIEEMRNKMMENRTTIPTGNESEEGGLSIESVQQELTDNWTKYKTDPIYRKTIQQKFDSVSKHSNFVDKSY